MPSPRLLIALSAAALALPVAGCGSTEKGLLKPSQADKLQNRLQVASRAVEDGKCDAARSAAQAGAEQVSKINGLDEELRTNLVDGFNHLNDRVNAECGQEEEETPTPTATETATEAPTETATEVPTETPTEVPTEEPTEEPTEAPTEEPTPVPTEDTGGAEG